MTFSPVGVGYVGAPTHRPMCGYHILFVAVGNSHTLGKSQRRFIASSVVELAYQLLAPDESASQLYRLPSPNTITSYP